MHPVGKAHDGAPGILVDLARSAYDESHIGRTSDPYLIEVDAKSIEKVAYAARAAHDWKGDPAAPGFSAPHAYLFYLINNTSTYRIYEQEEIVNVAEGRARLHTGDDFYLYEPVIAGDTLAVTTSIKNVQRKQSRHGMLTMFEDEWRMFNQHNRLAACLVRKGALVHYEGDRKLQTATGPTAELPNGHANASMATQFSPGDVTHTHDHGPIRWIDMMAWLAAVDEFAPTHYDPDFARARRYKDNQSIVAGPQMAAFLVAPLEETLGSRWRITSYENIQRHPVYPNDRLYSFGIVDSFERDASKTTLRVKLTLLDESGLIRGRGAAIAHRIDDEQE